MAIKTMIITGIMVVAASIGSAKAASITYVGEYSPDLMLTVTTDGVMGDIVATDIVSFDVKSPVFQDGSFDSSDGDVVFMGGFEGVGPAMTASTKGLSYDFGDSPYDIEFEGESPTNQNDLLLIQSDGGFVGGSGFYVASSASEDNGTLITESGTTIIATPVMSAAPEPAAWSLMICGLALVGGALRLGRRGRATVDL